VSGAFSALVACDNSIPHLLTDAELLECFATERMDDVLFEPVLVGRRANAG
jgi:hypothetical protein